ncbi:MAG: hypothetical protein HQL57_03665 [Magnetococcales bacterium]|nr:hypothetical protein [Magnetococcales bacterium]MBF0156266.1 hypothetical protein [Magnetococcales bacterium]
MIRSGGKRLPSYRNPLARFISFRGGFVRRRSVLTFAGSFSRMGVSPSLAC